MYQETYGANVSYMYVCMYESMSKKVTKNKNNKESGQLNAPGIKNTENGFHICTGLLEGKLIIKELGCIEHLS